MFDPRRSCEPPKPEAKTRPRDRPEALILALAHRQHGVVTRVQLLEAGLTRAEIEHRLRLGWLTAIHRGVYRVGPTPAPRAWAAAAVLACGFGSCLSHWSAAALFDLPAPAGHAGAVHVTAPRVRWRVRPGLVLHRPLVLAGDEVTERHGIPVTTPARTLLDLLGSNRPELVSKTLDEALVQRMTTPPELLAMVDRHPRAQGAAVLRAMLLHAGEDFRSDAERRFRELMARAALPAPQMNHIVLGRRRDGFWPDAKLVVEIDGFRFHGVRKRFESDRRRDQELIAAGYRVLRFTWAHLENEPMAVVAIVAQALAR